MPLIRDKDIERLTTPVLLTINIPEWGDWECALFGGNFEDGSAYIYRPVKGNEPNWFWRWMQFLAFGNRWRKLPENIND